MRDPKSLKVFALADALVEPVYLWTVALPTDEKYGLVTQIRRSVVSVGSNLVEGCSRESAADFRRFVEIALGSAMELRYQLEVASRVHYAYVTTWAGPNVRERANELVQALIGFAKALRSDSGA